MKRFVLFIEMACVSFLLVGCMGSVQQTQAPASARESEVNIVIADKNIDKTNDCAKMEAHYVHYGVSAVDNYIDNFVNAALDTANAEFNALCAKQRENKTEMSFNYSFVLSADTERAEKSGIDVLFTTSQYSGGPHENLVLNAMMFDPASGKRLEPMSLFTDKEQALVLMSKRAFEQVKSQTSDLENIDDMIRQGTSPKTENYRHIIRTNTGIRVYFEPYQAAPWASGVLKAEFSKDELKSVMSFGVMR